MLSFFLPQICFLGQVLGERAQRSFDFLVFNDKCDSSGAVNVSRNLNKWAAFPCFKTVCICLRLRLQGINDANTVLMEKCCSQIISCWKSSYNRIYSSLTATLWMGFSNTAGFFWQLTVCAEWTENSCLLTLLHIHICCDTSIFIHISTVCSVGLLMFYVKHVEWPCYQTVLYK